MNDLLHDLALGPSTPGTPQFTDSVRRILREARSLAVREAHAYLGAEHLVLALLQDQMGLSAGLLRDAGLDGQQVARLAVGLVPASKAVQDGEHLVISPGLKSALRRALRLAESRGDSLVGTEHILLALLDQPQGSGANLLRAVGVDPAHLRKELEKLLGEAPAQEAPEASQETSFVFKERYRIEAAIGEGQLSRVYRAQDLRYENLVRTVAIKELLPPADDPAVREALADNFRREAGLLAALRHPFIPRFYDFFAYENRFYLVMEYIEGSSLGDLLAAETGLLPLSRVLKWGLQICDVLAYLHNQEPQPIVFRDLKPDNLLIDLQDNVRLIDFNIARVLEPGAAGARVGTPGYSPPEQYHGDITPASDLYALGATLHYLLTSQDPQDEPPFSFEDRPISRYNPHVPQALEGAIYKALAYSPEDRYSSAEAMKAALMAAARQASA